VSAGSLPTQNHFLFASPGPPGEVAAQQTEGAFFILGTVPVLCFALRVKAELAGCHGLTVFGKPCLIGYSIIGHPKSMACPSGQAMAPE